MNRDNENPTENIGTEQDAPVEQDAPELTAQANDTPAEREEERAGGCARVVGALKKFGKAAWEYCKGARIELLVLAAILVVDLITKALVGKFMTEGQSITVLPEFLYITYVRNTKAAFGSAFGLEKVMSDEAIRIIFLIITVLAVGVFCYLLYRLRKRHLLMRLAIAMIIGGALGNFFDRLVFAYVRDFIEIVFFGCNVPLLGKTFPVFNVADMGLTIGVLLFLIYFIAIYKEPKKSEPTTAGVSDGAAESAETENVSETNGAEQKNSPDESAAKTDSDSLVKTDNRESSIASQTTGEPKESDNA